MIDQEKALPIADSMTTHSIFDWLERLAACVRAVDYSAARPFWHRDIIVFGTYQELVRGRELRAETQWSNVWPRASDSAFDLDNTVVFSSTDGGIATVSTPWTSTGFQTDGSRFDRPGRATIILARNHDKRWVGIHSNMSLQRGVPQDSYGNRPA